MALVVKGNDQYSNGYWRGTLPTDESQTMRVTGLNVVQRQGEGAFVLMHAGGKLGLLPPDAFKGGLKRNGPNVWWQECLKAGGAVEMMLKPNSRFGTAEYSHLRGFPRTGDPVAVYACGVSKNRTVVMVEFYDYRPGHVSNIMSLGQICFQMDKDSQAWFNKQLNSSDMAPPVSSVTPSDTRPKPGSAATTGMVA